MSGLRRVSLDLHERTVSRLETLKAEMEAASYSEVVRAGLRALEREMEMIRASDRQVSVK